MGVLWEAIIDLKIAALLFTDPDEITMNNIEERTIGVDDDNHKFDMNICDKKL